MGRTLRLRMHGRPDLAELVARARPDPLDLGRARRHHPVQLLRPLLEAVKSTSELADMVCAGVQLTSADAPPVTLGAFLSPPSNAPRL